MHGPIRRTGHSRIHKIHQCQNGYVFGQSIKTGNSLLDIAHTFLSITHHNLMADSPSQAVRHSLISQAFNQCINLQSQPPNRKDN